MVVFFFLFITLGIPLAMVGLMYDGNAVDAVPVHLYTEDANAMNLIYENLHEALADVKEDMDADFNYQLSQDTVNILIFNMIRGDNNDEEDEDAEAMNPNYLPNASCEDDACRYVIAETVELGTQLVHYRVHGIWLTFEEDTFILNVAFEAQRGDGFTFQSSVQIDIEIIDDLDNGEYRIEFDRMKLGRLPLPKFIFTSLMNLFGSDEEDPMSDAVPLGQFNASELRLTVNKQALVNYLTEDEENGPTQLAAEVLGVIFEERLIKMKMHDEYFQLSFVIATLRNDPDTDIPVYLHEMRNAEELDETVFDYEQHMKSRFEQFVFNKALTNQGYFTITERSFNMIVYFEMDGFESTQTTYEYEDSNGDEQTIMVGLEALWFEFRTEDEQVYIHIKGLFNFDGIKSLLIIRADDTGLGAQGEYIFDFKNLRLGYEPDKDHLHIQQMDAIRDALKNMGEFPFGEVNEEGRLVIDTNGLTDFLDDGTNEDVINVHDIEIVHGGIRVYVEPTTTLYESVLNAYTDELFSVFEDNALLSNLEASFGVMNDQQQNTYNQVAYIQSLIDSNQDVAEEDVDVLFSYYEKMDQTSQEAFMDTFESMMDPNIVEVYSGIFKK